MRCEEVKKLLEIYVEGELDESEREEVDAHITNCQACKQELALTQSIPRLINSLQTPPVPEDIIPNTLERIHETPATRWAWLRSFGAFLSERWQLAAVASVLIAIVLFGIGYQRMNRKPEITEVEVASAAAEIRLALGIVGAATQEVQHTALTTGAKVLDVTRTKSKDTMRTLSKAQLEVVGKLKRNLAFLGQP